MPNYAVIGYGAMAGHVVRAVADKGWAATHCVVRPDREDAARAQLGDAPALITDVAAILNSVDLVVDCAGHAGLAQHGTPVLRAGVPLITASLGALADDALHGALVAAAQDGGTQLHLVSGAIGALDALSAAKQGHLSDVQYVGRKPPAGWRGSPAEDVLDLDGLTQAAAHFTGTARKAATRYPKNANVAAAVALAGIGFDATQVTLIADPDVQGNEHRITAKGDFGSLEFSILGNSLPENPRTSALAAMSMVAAIVRRDAAVVI